jgi:hypothetical protein
MNQLFFYYNSRSIAAYEQLREGAGGNEEEWKV